LATTAATPPKTVWGRTKAKALKERKSIAYVSLMVFAFLYYMRPQDVIPGLGSLPLEKIGGGVALLALIFGVLPKDRGRIPTELKILLLLLAHMILTIPFAFWRGGAFDAVFTRFSKGVIVALLIGLIVSKVFEMRRLLFIQAGSVALVAVLSVLAHNTIAGQRPRDQYRHQFPVVHGVHVCRQERISQGAMGDGSCIHDVLRAGHVLSQRPDCVNHHDPGLPLGIRGEAEARSAADGCWCIWSGRSRYLPSHATFHRAYFEFMAGKYRGFRRSRFARST
jgi:hypothetical protein